MGDPIQKRLAKFHGLLGIENDELSKLYLAEYLRHIQSERVLKPELHDQIASEVEKYPEDKITR